MTEPISLSAYARAIIIDTQVVLETKPLDQLPWGELGSGPLLLLVTRQVQSEIDAKKNDGRLGRRARAFNKLLDSFLESRLPATLSAGPPRVDVALVANARIDWAVLDDLDGGDGDDRIVAQALYAQVDDRTRLEVLSHDMRPRDAAATHGLRAVRLPEHWLREPEPSPEQREIARLEREVRLLRTEQPAINVSVEAITPAPWRKVAVAPAPAEHAARLRSAILATIPEQETRGSFQFASALHDHSFEERVEEWRKRLEGRELPAMHLGLERLYAQKRIAVTVSNVGAIPAEGLSLEIRSGNATLHTLPYWVLIFGETAPEPRYFHDPLRHMHFDGLRSPHRPEPFTFYEEEEGPGALVSWSCASFRQEKLFRVELSVEIAARTGPKAQIEAVVTAANLKGDVRSRLLVPVDEVSLGFDEAIDMDGLKLRGGFDFDVTRGVEKSTDVRWFRNDGSVAQTD